MNTNENTPPPHEPWAGRIPDRKPEPSGDEVRRAVTYGAVVLGLTVVAFLIAPAVTGGARNAALIVGTVVILVGALGALWQTYRTWRARGRWQVWQGAAWFLLAGTLLCFTTTTPVLLGAV